MRKEDIPCNKQFLLFSQCFLPCMPHIFHIKCILKMLSAICFILDQSKILSPGNGLGLLLYSKLLIVLGSELHGIYYQRHISLTLTYGS